MVSWREIASCWELQWRWRRFQVGRKREAEEVGGLRGDEVVDGRKGVRAEMVATSDGPHRMPGKGTSEGIKHFELTGLDLDMSRFVECRCSRAACRRIGSKPSWGVTRLHCRSVRPVQRRCQAVPVNARIQAACICNQGHNR